MWWRELLADPVPARVAGADPAFPAQKRDIVTTIGARLGVEPDDVGREFQPAGRYARAGGLLSRALQLAYAQVAGALMETKGELLMASSIEVEGMRRAGELALRICSTCRELDRQYRRRKSLMMHGQVLSATRQRSLRALALSSIIYVCICRQLRHRR